MENSLLSLLRVYHYFNIMQINREFFKHILNDLSLIIKIFQISIYKSLDTFDSESVYYIVFKISVEIVMSSLIKIFKSYGYQK